MAISEAALNGNSVNTVDSRCDSRYLSCSKCDEVGEIKGNKWSGRRRKHSNADKRFLRVRQSSSTTIWQLHRDAKLISYSRKKLDQKFAIAEG